MDAKEMLESIVKYLNSEGYETVIVIASKPHNENNVSDHVFLSGTIGRINDCLKHTQGKLMELALNEINKQKQNG